MPETDEEAAPARTIILQRRARLVARAVAAGASKVRQRQPERAQRQLVRCPPALEAGACPPASAA